MIDFAFQESQLSGKTQVRFLFSHLPFSGASNLGKSMLTFLGKLWRIIVSFESPGRLFLLF